MTQKVTLLSEDELDEISSIDLAPDEVDRLVAIARWAAQARDLLRDLNDEEQGQEISSRWMKRYARLMSAIDAPTEGTHP